MIVLSQVGVSFVQNIFRRPKRKTLAAECL